MSIRKYRPQGSLLVAFAGGNLVLKVPLLVVQILQLEVQSVYFLPRLGRDTPCVPSGEGDVAVEAAKVRDTGEEVGLLLCDFGLVGPVAGLDEVDEREGLVAGLLGCLEGGGYAGIGYEVVDRHVGGW